MALDEKNVMKLGMNSF